MIITRRERRVRSAVGMAALSCALAVPLMAAASPAPRDDRMQVYAITATGVDAGALGANLAAAGFDVVDRDGATLTVLGDVDVAARLRATDGVVINNVTAYASPTVASTDAGQDAILPRRLDGNSYSTFYGGYRTVAGYEQFEDDLATAYPHLVKIITYGTSWSGAHDLRAVCVTLHADRGCALDPDSAKPRFLVVAQTHARELTTSELMWRYLTYLVDGNGRNPETTAILKSTEIWIVPQVNPDGIEVTQTGIKEDGFGSDSRAWQRKNVNDTNSPQPCSGPWSGSQEGVDLNRNFDVDWGNTGTSDHPCNLVYGGPTPASEPEVIAQQELFAQLYPDSRPPGMNAPAPDSTRGSMLTLHSYANEVLLPWGFTTQHAPNNTGLRSFGFRMSYFNGFETGQSGEILYNSSGATEDWLYDQLGVAGFTWEIGSGGGQCGGFFPAYSCQDGIFADNRNALMYAAAAARRPYVQTLGPTVLRTKSNTHGQTITVTARADDDAYGDDGVGRPSAQAVTAARVYVGAPPWNGGSATAMTIMGSGSSVRATADVPVVTHRTLGYVQARDAQGNWGPVRAEWLTPAG